MTTPAEPPEGAGSAQHGGADDRDPRGPPRHSRFHRLREGRRRGGRSDKDALLDLPAGRQTPYGEDALGWVRARKRIGDGSDTERMERQQEFLASLVKKTNTNGVLLAPPKLYPLLDAATSSLTADEGLDSLSELYDLVESPRSTPTDAAVRIGWFAQMWRSEFVPHVQRRWSVGLV